MSRIPRDDAASKDTVVEPRLRESASTLGERQRRGATRSTRFRSASLALPRTHHPISSDRHAELDVSLSEDDRERERASRASGFARREPSTATRQDGLPVRSQVVGIMYTRTTFRQRYRKEEVHAAHIPARFAPLALLI